MLESKGLCVHGVSLSLPIPQDKRQMQTTDKDQCKEQLHRDLMPPPLPRSASLAAGLLLLDEEPSHGTSRSSLMCRRDVSAMNEDAPIKRVKSMEDRDKINLPPPLDLSTPPNTMNYTYTPPSSNSNVASEIGQRLQCPMTTVDKVRVPAPKSVSLRLDLSYVNTPASSSCSAHASPSHMAHACTSPHVVYAHS